MWRLISVVTAIASFVSVFLYWSKRKQLHEDDHYYLYGDSLYQELTDEHLKVKNRNIDIQSGTMDDTADISNLVN